jgi:transposase
LTVHKVSLKVSGKELAGVKQNATVNFIACLSLAQVKEIDKQLKEINARISSLLSSDKELYSNYQLLASVKGVGLENAVMMLVITGNFTLFDDPRKFGCYAGVVPFAHSSGTSIKAKDKVSNLADKRLKSILTEAARVAIRHDKNLKEYYIRKLQEGKDRFLVLNNVRNKFIHIMFAVVKNKQMYNPDYYSNYNQPA